MISTIAGSPYLGEVLVSKMSKLKTMFGTGRLVSVMLITLILLIIWVPIVSIPNGRTSAFGRFGHGQR